jgi:hypothetical protein
MSRARRFTALIVSILLGHVLWAAGGFACVPSGMGDGMSMTTAATDSPAKEMAGMDMARGPVAPSDTPPEHGHGPCSLPWAPNGCQSMVAPCAPLAIASHGDLLQTVVSGPAAVERIEFLTPPSQVRAPELPPPRA